MKMFTVLPLALVVSTSYLMSMEPACKHQFFAQDYQWIKNQKTRKWSQVPVAVTQQTLTADEAMAISTLAQSSIRDENALSSLPLEQKSAQIKAELDAIELQEINARQVAILATKGAMVFYGSGRSVLPAIEKLEKQLDEKKYGVLVSETASTQLESLVEKNEQRIKSRNERLALEQASSTQSTSTKSSWFDLLSYFSRSK